MPLSGSQALYINIHSGLFFSGEEGKYIKTFRLIPFNEGGIR